MGEVFKPRSRPPGIGPAISRFLFSCGYRVSGLAQKVEGGGGGWTRCAVVCRDTGADRGVRWVRPRSPNGGFEITSVDPCARRLAS